MSAKTTLLFISLLLFAVAVTADEHAPHVCNHHEVKVEPEFMDIPITTPTEGRILQSYQGIRLYFDFTFASNINSDFSNYVQNSLLAPAINYFQSTIKVLPVVGNLTASKLSACIGKNPIPSIYTSTGVPADMAIFVTIVNDAGSSYSASAASCVQNTQNNRPIFGTIAFNIAKLKPSNDTSIIERDTTVVMHELTHAMVFSPNLFPYYINPATNQVLTNQLLYKMVNGQNITVLNVAPLTSRLRTYFNCSTLQGAYLENEGGVASAGTHFERRIFYNEYMTSSTYPDFRITQFTLALFEGSGWYQVDYSMAEPMTYGQNKGCSFVDGPCVNSQNGVANYKEYCPSLASKTCTWTYRGLGFCGTAAVGTSSSLTSAFNYWGNNTIVSDTFSDNCPITTLYTNMDCEDSSLQSKATMPNYEYYGFGAKCFMSNLNTPGRISKQYGYCFKQACGVQTDGTPYVNVTLGSTTVTCATAGQLSIKGFTGQLTCPDPATFCNQISAEGYCKRMCSGRGACQNKVCNCNDGWGFNDCSQQTYTDNCDSCANSDPLRTSCYGDTCTCNPSNTTCMCALGLTTGSACNSGSDGSSTSISSKSSSLMHADDAESEDQSESTGNKTTPVFYISTAFIVIVAVGSFVILVIGILLGARYAEKLKSLVTRTHTSSKKTLESKASLKKASTMNQHDLQKELEAIPAKYSNVE